MGEKYFTVSYDDGLEQDRRIIALMERYGIRGTFNLSSGMFGKKSYIRRVGALSKGAAQKDSAGLRELSAAQKALRLCEKKSARKQVA